MMHKRAAVWMVTVILLITSVTVWANEDTTGRSVEEIAAQVAEQADKQTEEPSQTVKSTGEEPYGGLDPDTVILKVGRDEILLRKAYFLLKFQQAIVQDMQKSVYGSLWYQLPLYEGDRSFQDNMKESIINLLVCMSLAKQHQKEYQVTVSKSEKEKIDQAVQLYLDSNSQEALEAMMADWETVTEVLTDYTILSKVIDRMTKDVSVEYGQAKTYSYIYASLGEDGGLPLDDVSESTETLIENFNTIHKEVSSGRSFENVAAEKGYPVAMHTYFPDDDRDQLQEFNQAMDGLETGETSQVTYIGNGVGVFIGCMQELDQDSLEQAKRDRRKNEQKTVLHNTMLAWQEEAKPIIDQDVWHQVTMVKEITVYRDDKSADAQTN